MADAIVQFLRNALCTVKNFNVLGDTFLYDANITGKYYSFPAPLDQTTPLEILIAITQFYAFVSISLTGYRMITEGSIRKLQLINRLVDLILLKKDDKSENVAARLVSESLVEEGDVATRSFFVGTNVLVLGLAFLWLFANSLHVTSTNWLGGLAGLIHALTVMEIGLLVFLFYMVKDAGSKLRKAFKMKQFANEIVESKNKLSSIDTLSVEQYDWLVDGWAPFWKTGASGSVASAEEKMLIKEEEAVAATVAAFSKSVNEDVVEKMLLRSRVSVFEGYREYVYLILNFFAFYGYLACILVYYYEDESTQPGYIRSMLLWLPNSEADWLGNATGDFMWTVEPLLTLSSPAIIKSMSAPNKKKKEKAE